MDRRADFNYTFLTQKERDNETGLDYFLARYYSSSQGRFTSPDEFKGGPEELFEDVDPHDPLFYADVAEPQSLNKYHYCLNNPLKYVDPDGHDADEPEPPPQDPKSKAMPAPPPIWPFSLPPKEVVQAMDKARDAVGAAAKDLGRDAVKGILIVTSIVMILTHPAETAPTTPPPLPQAQPAQPLTTMPPTPLVQPMPPPPPAEAHRKDRRKSTEDKHDKGTSRAKRDKGGEKADPGREKMPWHRKRPDKWKGPWPPKPNAQ